MRGERVSKVLGPFICVAHNLPRRVVFFERGVDRQKLCPSGFLAESSEAFCVQGFLIGPLWASHRFSGTKRGVVGMGRGVAERRIMEVGGIGIATAFSELSSTGAS